MIDTDAARGTTTGIHPHPTRPDLEIQVHECEHQPGRYWSSISPGPLAVPRRAGNWCSCSAFTGNVMHSDYTTPRAAYHAAVALTAALDAMLAAARGALR